MGRTIKIGAIQMIAEPAPTSERLERAEKLVREAAELGAQLVVLPEVFNTGYAYREENYACAEPMTGPTVIWMKRLAAEQGVHLAGSLLLLENDDIYNTMLLFAPNGKMWRYDKNFPWAMERAYFKEGRSVTVAETELGKLGMLICWDSMHPELWERYAGNVEAMVICSCPPAVHDLTLVLPDGLRVTSEEMGPVWRHLKHTSGEAFGTLLRRQAARLGVPVVNTTGTGMLKTHFPAPYLLYLVYSAFRPRFLRYLPKADQIQAESGYYQETYVADGVGSVIAQVEPMQEGVVVAEVKLPDTRPQPDESAPRFGLSRVAYLMDVLVNGVMVPVYRQGMRRAYGEKAAPVSPQTKVWTMAVILAYWWGNIRGYSRGRQSMKKHGDELTVADNDESKVI